MTKSCKKNRNSEKGIALFVAIFTVLLITAIGASMIMLTMITQAVIHTENMSVAAGVICRQRWLSMP